MVWDDVFYNWLIEYREELEDIIENGIDDRSIHEFSIKKETIELVMQKYERITCGFNCKFCGTCYDTTAKKTECEILHRELDRIRRLPYTKEHVKVKIKTENLERRLKYFYEQLVGYCIDLAITQEHLELIKDKSITKDLPTVKAEKETMQYIKNEFRKVLED